MRLDTTGWKLCKKLKFGRTTKWYMHKLKPLVENETQKNQLELEILTDPPILALKPNLIIINEKNKQKSKKKEPAE